MYFSPISVRKQKMAKSNSKSSANFFQTISPQKMQKLHSKKTPDSKKTGMLSPASKITQAMRMSSLEQRLKDRQNKSSAIKFYQTTNVNNLTQKPASLPKIQKFAVPVVPLKQSKAQSKNQQPHQPVVEALRGVLVNAWPETDSVSVPVVAKKQPFVMTRNESIPAALTTSAKTMCSNKAVVVDNRFEVKKKIDEGTYAKVYQALDWQQGGKEVVIKILRQRAYIKAKDKAQV